MSIVARITNDKKLELYDEIIEYPAELEGGRNLALGTSNKFGEVTVGEWSGSLVSGGVTSKFTYTLEELDVKPGDTMTVSMYVGESVEGYGTGFRIDGLTHIIYSDTVKNGYTSKTFTITEGTTEIRLYTGGFGNSGAPSSFKVPIKQLKLEKGNKATDWTPAPEDLGLEYLDDIQHFNTGFRADGKMLVREFIEGEGFSFSTDKKMYLNKLEEGVEFNG